MKIKELLKEPLHWTTGTPARNINGNDTSASGEEAVCWCLVGAAFKCYPDKAERTEVIDKLSEVLGHCIGRWNDTHTHADVLKLVETLDI